MKIRLKDYKTLLLMALLIPITVFSTENPTNMATRICVDENVDWFPGGMRHLVARKQIEKYANDNEKVMLLFDTLVAEWACHSLDQIDGYPVGLLVETCILSAKKHKGKVHKDDKNTPYIFYPLTICYNLWNEVCVRNTNILIAAILYDTIE